MTVMNIAQTNIIDAMNGNIFEGYVDTKIRSEVPFFRKILIDNYYNLEYFHGYVNKIYDAWASILTYNFKRLISIYNREHDLFLYKENQRKEEMLRMATQMATEDMLGDLADLEVGTSMSSLINSIKKSGISKKGPSKKKLKK
tara:strand:- start:16220 stop:16648 length:429 start_codon:yes stop_codon:yes gene_type:complete